MKTLMVVSGDGCAEEKEIIRFWKRKGARLTNITEGGEGTTGWKASDETRKKQSLAKLGKKLSLQTRQKMSEARKGVRRIPFTDTHRKNMSLARKGKVLSLEHRLKISEGGKGKKLNYNQRMVLLVSNLTREYSVETRSKMRSSAIKAHKRKSELKTLTGFNG